MAKFESGHIVKKDLTSRQSWTIEERDGKIIGIPNTNEYFTDKTEIEITEENEHEFVRILHVRGNSTVWVTPEFMEESKKIVGEFKDLQDKLIWGEDIVDKVKEKQSELAKSSQKKVLTTYEREMNSPYKDLYRRCRELDKTLSISELNIVNGAYPELVRAFFDHFKKLENGNDLGRG